MTMSSTAACTRPRHKLEADLRAPHMIQTERGAGYTFALPWKRSDEDGTRRTATAAGGVAWLGRVRS